MLSWNTYFSIYYHLHLIPFREIWISSLGLSKKYISKPPCHVLTISEISSTICPHLNLHLISAVNFVNCRIEYVQMNLKSYGASALEHQWYCALHAWNSEPNICSSVCLIIYFFSHFFIYFYSFMYYSFIELFIYLDVVLRRSQWYFTDEAEASIMVRGNLAVRERSLRPSAGCWDTFPA